jgi:membrane protein required for beta-lactamase induction
MIYNIYYIYMYWYALIGAVRMLSHTFLVYINERRSYKLLIRIKVN